MPVELADLDVEVTIVVEIVSGHGRSETHDARFTYDLWKMMVYMY